MEYRLIRKDHGSSKYGKCEVCWKDVDTSYHITIYAKGTKIPINDLYGHKKCLLEIIE